MIDEHLPENQEGSDRIGVDLFIAMEDQEITEKTEPVRFAPQEFGDLAKHVNPCARPIPHDFLRFDCADMGKPMRGILYESDQWMNTRPIGEQEWGAHHIPSTDEVETERFLEEKGEVGDRATYVRFRMLTMNAPLEESY